VRICVASEGRYAYVLPEVQIEKLERAHTTIQDVQSM
jgi:hypothetical protein